MAIDVTSFDNRLLDPPFYTTDEYHEAFRLMRDDDPVRWVKDERFGKSYWAVTRYDDVKAYLLDDRRLSSRWNTRVPRTPQRMTPEERYVFGMDVLVATTDGGTHAAYRRPMNKHFSVPAIVKMRTRVEEIVDGIIVEAAERGEVDFVEDIGGPLALRVILSLLGVPESDWEYLRLISWQSSAASDPMKTHWDARAKILDYAENLAMDRRKNPRDDFATIVAQLTMDGDPLSIHEMRTWIFAMIAGGLETTRNTAATGMYAYMENPDQARLLREDPTLSSSALDEVLRWVTPAKNRLRIAAEDFEFGGKNIRTGDWVVGFLASANKDERQYEDPHRFDIRRTPNEHLSLGLGRHLCLGRALARLELTVLFEKLFSAFSDIQRTENELAWIADAQVTGFHRLPVKVTPARRMTPA